MRFRILSFLKYFWQLLPYLKVTFIYVVVSLFWGIVFGAVLTRMKVGKNPVLKWISNIYTAVFRSVPPVVLLFLVYYGLPIITKRAFNISLRGFDSLFFVIITISLLSIASVSEVMRSAYTSVDRGQYEAAVSIGLSRFQALRRIVLPQAFYYALPNMGNIIIFLLKDGSLAFTIGLIDIFGKANSLNQNTYSNYILEIYVALALIYWILSILIDKVLKRLEYEVSIQRAIERGQNEEV